MPMMVFLLLIFIIHFFINLFSLKFFSNCWTTFQLLLESYCFLQCLNIFISSSSYVSNTPGKAFSPRKCYFFICRTWMFLLLFFPSIRKQKPSWLKHSDSCTTKTSYMLSEKFVVQNLSLCQIWTNTSVSIEKVSSCWPYFNGLINFLYLCVHHQQCHQSKYSQDCILLPPVPAWSHL